MYGFIYMTLSKGKTIMMENRSGFHLFRMNVWLSNIISLKRLFFHHWIAFTFFQIPIGNIYVGLGRFLLVGDSVLCSIEICTCPFDSVTFIISLKIGITPTLFSFFNISSAFFLFAFPYRFIESACLYLKNILPGFLLVLQGSLYMNWRTEIFTMLSVLTHLFPCIR